MLNLKKTCILTLLIFFGAGFSFLDDFDFSFKKLSIAEAARKSKKSSNKKKSEKKTDVEKSDNSSNDDDLLLMDNEKAKSYMPDIFRCPDCGYEQDEEGYCPDHTTLELVKVISKDNNPLAPKELDGNEDILVDVPLNINFKRDKLEKMKNENLTASESKKITTNSEKSTSKSSKKSKKSKK